MDGINGILWFIHRTVFELVPALIADTIIYFFFINKPHASYLNYLNNWIDIFQNSNDFLKCILIFGIAVSTSLFLKSISYFFNWMSLKSQENSESYPNYVGVKKKIADELKISLGDKFKFNPHEIVNFMRYKVMEEHKEFNTYLWYRSTEYYAIRELATMLILLLVLLLPFECLESPIVLWQYMLMAILGSFPFFILFIVLRCKIKEINRIQAEENNRENTSEEEFYNRKPIFKWSKIDWSLLIFLTIGVVLNFIQSYFSNKIFNSILFIWEINFMLFMSIYFLFLYVFLEHKSFRHVLIDTFISLHYS